MFMQSPLSHAPNSIALQVLRSVVTFSLEGPDSVSPETTPVLDAAAFKALSVMEVRCELDRLLLGKHVEEALEELLKCGFLDAWLPEVTAMVGFGDGEFRHKDVWKHTKQVVRQAVPRLTVRWGALLHDIGKVKTRSKGPKGEVHFFGHSEVGAAMFRKSVAKRLKFEGDLYDRVEFLILYHLRPSQYDPSWTDSAVRRFAKEAGDGLRDLLDLSRADMTTKRRERRQRNLQLISELGARVRQIQELDAKVPKLPKGLGTALIQHFAIPPSKRIAEIKTALEMAVERGEIEAHQSDEYYVAWVQTHREKFNI